MAFDPKIPNPLHPDEKIPSYVYVLKVLMRLEDGWGRDRGIHEWTLGIYQNETDAVDARDGRIVGMHDIGKPYIERQELK